MIAIVDYNMGNLASVKNAFAKLGKQTVVESDPTKFNEYDKLADHFERHCNVEEILAHI